MAFGELGTNKSFNKAPGGAAAGPNKSFNKALTPTGGAAGDKQAGGRPVPGPPKIEIQEGDKKSPVGRLRLAEKALGEAVAAKDVDKVAKMAEVVRQRSDRLLEEIKAQMEIQERLGKTGQLNSFLVALGADWSEQRAQAALHLEAVGVLAIDRAPELVARGTATVIVALLRMFSNPKAGGSAGEAPLAGTNRHRSSSPSAAAVFGLFAVRHMCGPRDNSGPGGEDKCIARRQELQGALERSDAVIVLPYAMRFWPDDSEVQHQGCGAIAHLCHQSSALQGKLAGCGACHAVLFAMRRLPSDPLVQRTGSEAIASLAEEKPRVGRLLRDEGAASVLLSAVQASNVYRVPPQGWGGGPQDWMGAEHEEAEAARRELWADLWADAKREATVAAEILPPPDPEPEKPKPKFGLRIGGK